MERVNAIYAIRSVLFPDRLYVGRSVNVYSRWNGHKSKLERGIHENGRLQNHVNKYGINDLSFFLLHDSSLSEMVDDETFFIESLDPYFNIRKTVDGIPVLPEWTAERRLQQSLRRIGRKSSEETRGKQSETAKRLGIKPPGPSPEQREAMKMALIARLTGRDVSQETRDKISKTLMGHDVPDDLRSLISVKTREAMAKKGYNTMIFSEEQVVYIREQYKIRTSKSISEEFNVSEGVIFRLVRDIKKGHKKPHF